MSVAKVIELTAESSESFEGVIRQGVAKAGESVRNIKGRLGQGAASHRLGRDITSFRVDLEVTFVIE